ncbi:MAG: hypothetical protein AB1374_06075 [Bacillota bacterium]
MAIESGCLAGAGDLPEAFYPREHFVAFIRAMADWAVTEAGYEDPMLQAQEKRDVYGA